jgi:tRNA(Arg) A34 adenosine deaminase TadA
MSVPGSQQTRFELALPDWMEPFLAAWSEPLESDEARMRLVVALAAENVRQQTGGPFAAIVLEEESGCLLGAGVNRVIASGLSLAHAEMLALSLAQSMVQDWNLGAGAAAQLVTSCEPCAMCFGAIPWSGVSSLVWGACKEDAEAAGFDEGDKPSDWAATLEARGIRTRGGVLRSEAAAVLQHYVSGNGAIYHPQV